jgi:hypothetical protein
VSGRSRADRRSRVFEASSRSSRVACELRAPAAVPLAALFEAPQPRRRRRGTTEQTGPASAEKSAIRRRACAACRATQQGPEGVRLARSSVAATLGPRGARWGSDRSRSRTLLAVLLSAWLRLGRDVTDRNHSRRSRRATSAVAAFGGPVFTRRWTRPVAAGQRYRAPLSRATRAGILAAPRTVARSSAPASEHRLIEAARQRSIEYRTRQYGRFPGVGSRRQSASPRYYAERARLSWGCPWSCIKVVPALACVETAYGAMREASVPAAASKRHPAAQHVQGLRGLQPRLRHRARHRFPPQSLLRLRQGLGRARGLPKKSRFGVRAHGHAKLLGGSVRRYGTLAGTRRARGHHAPSFSGPDRILE